jgi:integrase
MRDPQASWPFDPNPGAELDRVLRAADQDSEMLGKIAKVLAFTGAHITVITGGWRRETQANGAIKEWWVDPIDGHAVRGNFIYWRRPKNEKPIEMPLSRHLQGWLPEFLNQPRPLTARRYEQLFDRVGEKLGLQVNPLRFRHTCGVLLFHIHHQPADVVQRLLGVTAQTVATYIARPPWVIAEELRASGF